MTNLGFVITHTLGCIGILLFLCVADIKTRYEKESVTYFSTIKLESV